MTRMDAPDWQPSLASHLVAMSSIPVKKVLTSQVSDGQAIGPACRSRRLDAASSEGSCASS